MLNSINDVLNIIEAIQNISLTIILSAS